MKNLSGFNVINISGTDRIAFTFDEIDENGELISQNNKKQFFVVDDSLKTHIQAIKDFIEANKF